MKLRMLIRSDRQGLKSKHSGITTCSIIEVCRHTDGRAGRFVVGERVGSLTLVMLQLAAGVVQGNNDMVYSLHKQFISIMSLLEPTS